MERNVSVSGCRKNFLVLQQLCGIMVCTFYAAEGVPETLPRLQRILPVVRNVIERLLGKLSAGNVEVKRSEKLRQGAVEKCSWFWANVGRESWGEMVNCLGRKK